MTRQLGDMMVLGEPPAKLWKALAVIADQLHATFAKQTWIAHADKSKESCVLASLTIRDFLRAVEIPAKVRPVVAIMRATKAGDVIHSVGVGHPAQVARPRHWVGHLVVDVPVPFAPVAPAGHSFLIDATLYPAIRPQWRGALTGMAALPVTPEADARRYMGMRIITAMEATDAMDGFAFELFYLDNPANNSWKRGPDARDKWKRASALAAMWQRFGKWEGVDYAL